MKKMKACLKVAAWVGVGIVALGTPLAFSCSESLMSIGPRGAGVAWWGFTWILGGIGTVLLLAGGFIAKPRFLPLGAIVIGLVYVSSFYGFILYSLENGTFLGFIPVLLPGLACIIGGIVMWRLSRMPSKVNQGNASYLG